MNRIKKTIATLAVCIISCSLQAQELTPQEVQLDKKMSVLRNELIRKAEQSKLSIYNSSFTQLRPFIDSSALYKLLQAMPKGGLLHYHNGAITHPDWVIATAAHFHNCYVYTGKDNDQHIYGQMAVFTKTPVPKGFMLVSQYLKSDKHALDSLKKLLTLNRYDLSDYMNTWVEFEKRFKRIGGLISYRPFFNQYCREAFSELINDHVQHVELRTGFHGLFDDRQTSYPADTLIRDIQRIIADLHTSHPAFTVRLIYSSFKFLDTTAVAKDLNEAFELKQRYPDLIAGFDLVADEATNHSVGYYSTIWNSIPALERKYGVAMPLFMHAGESSTTANHNLQEVPFELNKRIGHGLNMIYFPEVMQRVKASGNLVEVCPLSNQELGYVSDLRNHPARVLLANGISISINSDDPGVFGYTGLSYDYWIAFMCWDLDVKTLKILLSNSLQYASLTEEEKRAALICLQKEWHRFVEQAIQ